MIVSLSLKQFRSFDVGSFEFEPGVNIVVGPNASGKTNLLEALLIVAQGSSYRDRDIELIHSGSPWARINALTEDNITRIVKLERENKNIKSFSIDGNKYLRLPFSKRIPVVVFEPNQLHFITSSPELRRLLIDSLLEQLEPEFGTIKRAYLRALAQRNSLLKTHNPQQKLFAWNIRLSEYATKVVEYRKEIIKTLNDQIKTTYSELAGKDQVPTLKYQSKLDISNYAQSMLKNLETRVAIDIERGFTTIGPHRDDIEMFIDDQSVFTTASRGEIRTLLLAIKLTEADLLSQKHDQKTLMLLDDVFGELDERRRKALTEHLKKHQAVITTTDADIVVSNYARHSNPIVL
ncbi:MAG: DNA replication and repair protein RecF [bacterium]|nr:DNA replication and repair protein RecF [bacterium]